MNKFSDVYACETHTHPTVSPGAPPKGDDEAQKIAMLLVSGENTLYCVFLLWAVTRR